MRKSTSTVTIFRFLAFLCFAGPLHAAQAQTAPATTTAQGGRQITGWSGTFIVLFDQNGGFLKFVDTGQLPPLPLPVTDADFNDARTRVRITMKSNGVDVAVYVDTTAVVLSRQPPPVTGPVITAHPPAPSAPSPGATLGTVAQNTDTGRPARAAITLNDPRVVDTATLRVDDTVVSLFGIEGQSGEAAKNLQEYLTTLGNHIICTPRPDAAYVCLTPNGIDVAKVVLLNGAARANQDAPQTYLEQEKKAQAARRGLWADLPGPTGGHTFATPIPEGVGHDRHRMATMDEPFHHSGGMGEARAGGGHLSAGGPSRDLHGPQKTDGHATHSPAATKD